MNPSERTLMISRQRMEALNGILEEYERLVKVAGEKGIFRVRALEPKLSSKATVEISFSLVANIYTDYPPPKPGLDKA
jgi:hypothetical protein